MQLHREPAHSSHYLPSERVVVPFPARESRGEGSLEVERINQFALYELGQALQRLRGYAGDIDAAAPFFDLISARSSMQNLLAGRPMALGVSRTRAGELHSNIENVISTHYYEKDAQGKISFKFPDPAAPKIWAWEWSTILGALDKFETVLHDELREATAYQVQQHGITSIPALVDSGEKAFPESIHHILGSKAILDFKAACRCFAFDLHTASGYHSARAVEAVLETYFQTFTNRPGETLNGWNDYVDALQKVKDKKPKPKFIPDARTLLSINEIRFHHRNPLMHPRATLNETDADMMLSIAKVAMVAMAMEIQTVWLDRKTIETKIKAKQKAA